ncbi:MAG: LacI family transcriptional regulator [Spirochaetes bacterium]|nr:LacI family transcriptional regulator [Spirochaetota bacterium]MBU0954715.1 LacI family transcriptional regulator [Spirochaetota bacterium]
MTSIKDVANHAKVSIATVSRALNGASNVTEATRKRILAAAKELNYHPNAMARSLVEKKSRIFGYIISGLKKGAKHCIVQDTLVGIYEYASSIGYEILMFAVDSNLQRSKSYVDFANEHALAGVIIQGLRTDDQYYREMIDGRIPCVLIDLPADSSRIGSVSIDNAAAAKEATLHLLAHGHRNIAFMTGVDEASVSTERSLGYLAALQQFGLAIKPEYLLHGNFSEDDAYTAVKDFLPASPEVSAVFCASDLMALGVLRAAKELNIKVPQELAVIGFDDILLAAYADPPLTTVHQDFTDLGFEAARMLYNIIKGQDVPHTRTVPHTFIVRKSG